MPTACLLLSKKAVTPVLNGGAPFQYVKEV